MTSHHRKPKKTMLYMLPATFVVAIGLSPGIDAKTEGREGEIAIGGHTRLELLVGEIRQTSLFDAHPSFRGGYEAFEAKPLELPQDTSVWLFFGTWCHDSQREVPRLLKLLEAAGLGEESLKLIGLDYRKREPGGRASEFNVRYTPTAVFMRGGVEVGRIVERPTTSLYEDIKTMFAEVN